MAEHGLRKRVSTTSYTFSLNPDNDFERREDLNQSHGSDQFAKPRGRELDYVEDIPHDESQKKKKKKKKKKVKDAEEDVQLQSYLREPWKIPSAASYHTPSEPETSISPEKSHDQFERRIPVAVQRQEERRGLHRQTSVVTVTIGTVVDPVIQRTDDLSPIETGYHAEDGVPLQSDSLSELPLGPKEGQDKVTDSAEAVNDMKVNPAGERDGQTAGQGALSPRQRVRSGDGENIEMRVVASGAAPVTAPKAKDVKAKTPKPSSEPPSDTAEPTSPEPEVMCCGLEVKPDGRLGTFLKKHSDYRGCRPAGGPFPAMWRGLQRVWSKMLEKKWPLAILIGSLLLLMFLILFPISLVQLHYHEIALKRTKSTQKIYRDEVFYAGCYVLGPNTEFVTYSRSVHIAEITDLSIFTSDRLQLNLDVVLHYFIRPEELGTLNANYGFGYKPIIRNIAYSTLKNTFTQFSLEQLLRSRADVETQLHAAVQRNLGGTCCMSCCTANDGCLSERLDSLCESCDSSQSCDQGQHMDVKHLHFLNVLIPPEITSRLMASVLADVNAETESLLRQRVIVEKESDRQVNVILNEANEIDGFASANASLTTKLAETEGDEVIVQNATLTGWGHMSSRLGLSAEDHKLSLFLLSSLEKMENLVMAQDYSQNTNVQGN